MSKKVYAWDDKSVLSTIKTVEDNYKLQENETFTKPEEGLYEPIKHTGDYPSDKWVGAPKEDWDKVHPQPAAKPTAQQMLNAQITMQMAELKADYQAQQKINAQLTLQNAQLAKQIKDSTSASTAASATTDPSKGA